MLPQVASHQHVMMIFKARKYSRNCVLTGHSEDHLEYLYKQTALRFWNEHCKVSEMYYLTASAKCTLATRCSTFGGLDPRRDSAALRILNIAGNLGSILFFLTE